MLFYFYPVTMIMMVLLMNMVTGIIVDNAMERRDDLQAEEAQGKMQEFDKRIPKLKELLGVIDANHNGKISIIELANASDDLKDELSTILPMNNLLAIFEIIDENETGEIEIDEFLASLRKVAISDTSLETLHLLKMVAMTRSVTYRILDGLNCMSVRGPGLAKHDMNYHAVSDGFHQDGIYWPREDNDFDSATSSYGDARVRSF
jgi:hypothetical protein